MAHPQTIWEAAEPLRNVERIGVPLVIHRALDDGGALHAWSLQLASRLGLPQTSYTSDGHDHLFRDDQFRVAVSRDAEFFEGEMAAP